MALKESTMLPLGTVAPDFDLPDPSGRRFSLGDFALTDILVVAFICNHCPFVKHIREGFASFAKEYQEKGVAVVAINSNDFVTHPSDSPEAMQLEIDRYGYGFPYLYDEDQRVAKNYRAMCTPEFYVFDRERRLTYRGRFDGARPGNDIPVTGEDLRDAIDSMHAGQDPDDNQLPSIGCNIKWKPGHTPDYAA